MPPRQSSARSPLRRPIQRRNCVGRYPYLLVLVFFVVLFFQVFRQGCRILYNVCYKLPEVIAPLPELMDRKKRDIMERKGDKEDENKRQKQQKESSAAAL